MCYDRTIFGWDTTICKSGVWGCKRNLNSEKIIFKVVQMKFSAMHITNKKFWYIYGERFTQYLRGTWSFLNILMTFGIKKNDNVDPYNICLAINTNIPVLLMTGFVLQGHICMYCIHVCVCVYIYIHTHTHTRVPQIFPWIDLLQSLAPDQTL